MHCGCPIGSQRQLVIDMLDSSADGVKQRHGCQLRDEALWEHDSWELVRR